MISKRKKAVCRKSLEDLRSSLGWYEKRVGERLQYCYPCYSWELFGLYGFDHRSPCYIFGKQLVLKIIDELLD